MKRNKIAALLVVMMFLLSGTFLAACKVEPAINLTLDKTTITIEVDEEAALQASLTNFDGVVDWASSDDTIVTVSDGKIKGMKKGSAIITAKADNITATCSVQVVSPSTVGTLTVNYTEVDMFIGDKITVSAEVTYGGASVTDLAYTWAENSNNEIISLASSGSSSVIEAKSVGGAKIDVSVVHKGVTLSEEIIVHVKNDVSVEIANLAAEDNGYILDLVPYVPSGYEDNFADEFDLEINVDVAGKSVLDPEYVIRLKTGTASDIVTVAGNKVVANQCGRADVEIAYTEENIEYIQNLTVTVSLAEINDDKSYDMELYSDTGVVANALLSSNVVSVKIDGTAVTFTQDGTAVTLSELEPFDFGEFALQIETETLIYNAKAFVVTMAISNKAELDLLSTVSKVDGLALWNGYYVLDADIEYNGVFATFCGNEQGGTWGGTTGFVGTFNGRGHVIKGMKIDGPTGGFIGTIGTEGVVKNVGFIDAEVKDSADRSGMVASFVYGKIENVFVDVLQNGAWHCAGLAEYAYSGSVVKNCVVFIRGTKVSDGNLALISFSNAATIENCYAVSEYLELYRTGGDAPVAGAESDTLKKFSTLAEFKDLNVNAESWDSSLWDTTSGAPIFKKYIEHMTLIVENVKAVKNQ